MSLTLRILLGFLVIGGLTFYFLLDRVLLRIERQYLEAAEDPMVDAAYLLAAVVTPELAASDPSWSSAVRETGKTNPNARIFSKLKSRVEMDFYITDAKGIVRFDSSGHHAIGADYSSFFDVFYTLRGRYGARSTRTNPDDDRSSIMFVGAPIRQNGEIVGVLSVYKPQRSLHEFMVETRRVLWGFGLIAVGAMVLGGLAASHWITSPIRSLTGYVEAVARGEKPKRPRFASRSMDQLARAFEEMRDAVQGKSAIETYVQTLTHEMKSPVAAIRGAAELLGEDMPEAQRLRFLSNIRTETERLANLTERLLTLSAVERRKELESPKPVNLTQLIHAVLTEFEPSLQNKDLIFQSAIEDGLVIRGEADLLRLAIANLIQNAIDFAPPKSAVRVQAKRAESLMEVEVSDSGPGVPDYACERVFERFYSLPRPASGRKSTGLGLCLVREATLLHGGSVTLTRNPDGGTSARITLPYSV
jgi:two-component system sensor histidine kinase CreC